MIKDASTRKSRGFGFVVYEDIQMLKGESLVVNCLVHFSTISDAMGAQPHVIKNKAVELKLAIPAEKIDVNPPVQKSKHRPASRKTNQPKANEIQGKLRPISRPQTNLTLSMAEFPRIS